MTANRSAAVGGWMDGCHLFAWLNLRFCLCFVHLSLFIHYCYSNFLIIIAADPRLRKGERGGAAPTHAAVHVNHDDLDRAAVLRMIKGGRLTVER